MSDKQKNLTDKEIEDLQNLVTETLTSVYAMADMLTAFAEVASVQDYETSHTNADRIRNMSDEELVELITGLSKECLAGIGECDCSAHKTCNNCNVEVKKWLQSEAEVGENAELLESEE